MRKNSGEYKKKEGMGQLSWGLENVVWGWDMGWGYEYNEYNNIFKVSSFLYHKTELLHRINVLVISLENNF